MPYTVHGFIPGHFEATILDYGDGCEQFMTGEEAVAYAMASPDRERGYGYLVVSPNSLENTLRFGIWPVCQIIEPAA